MSLSTRLRLPATCTLLGALAMAPLTTARAASLYWDTNGATAGSGGPTPSGSWAGTNWSLSTTGTLAPVMWIAGSDAVFSAGTDGTGSFAVNVATTGLGLRNLTTEEGNVTLGASGSLSLSAAATWTIGAGTSLSVQQALAMNNRLLTFADTGNTTLSGVVSGSIAAGSSAIVKNGTGTLTLSGANTYTGRTTVNAGVLSISADNNLGGAPGSATTGQLVLNFGTLQATSSFALSSTRGITIGANGGADQATFEVTGANVLSYGGIIANQSNGGDILNKTGTGTLVLSGANGFAGSTNVQAGVLNIQNNNGLGTSAGGATVASGAALQIQGNLAVADTMNLSGTGIANDGALRNIGGSSTLSGAVTLAGASRINSDAGTLILSGAIGGAAQNLTVGGAGNVTISNVIGTTTGTLTKDGAGTLTLSGAGANTFTGLTTVSAGELDLNKTAGVNAVGGNVTVTGGTLKWLANEQLSNAATTTLTLGSGGALDLNGKTETTGIFTNSGGIFQTGHGGKLILTGANTLTWSGGTSTVNADATVSDNHIVITGGTNTVQGAAGPVAGAAGGVLQLTSGGAGLEMTGGGITLNSDATGAGKLLLGGDVITYASAASSFIGNGGTLAASGTVDLGAAIRTFTVADGAAAADLAIGAQIANGGLTKAGAGQMTLSGANTYTGATTVNAGVLKAGGAAGGQAFGSNSAVTLANVAGAALDLNGFNQTIGSLAGGGATGGNVALGAGSLTTGGNNTSTSYAGAIGGSGGLTKTGTGIQTLSGTNTYTGATNINGGTLLVNGTHNAAAGTYDVALGGKLGGSGTITTTGAMAIGGQVTGGGFGAIGTLTLAGAGNRALTGTYLFDINYGTAASGDETGDLLNITGASAGSVSVAGGKFQLNAVGGATPAAGSHYAVKIFSSNVAVNGAPAGQSNYAGAVSGLAAYQSIVTWDGGKTYYLVPEPGSLALLGMGSMLLLRRPSRRRGRAA